MEHLKEPLLFSVVFLAVFMSIKSCAIENKLHTCQEKLHTQVVDSKNVESLGVDN